MELSIIIPIYNGEKYIKKIIDNIFDKNVDIDFEIILVDDGSKDSSRLICENFSGVFSNVRCLSKENGGIADARNYGLQYAKGDYITFVDQDDQLLSGYYEFICQLKKVNADILISDTSQLYKGRFTKSNAIKRDCCISEKNKILDVINYMILGNYYKKTLDYAIPNTIWNCIFKREIILTNHIEIKKYVDYEDDWIFLIENLMCSSKVYLTTKIFYCWTIYDSSESHKYKYISDFFSKRSNLIHWVNLQLEKTNLDSKTINHFKNVLHANNYIWML